MTKFIDAYSVATGEKCRVPEHFFDHPALCKGLKKTPTTRAAETPKPKQQVEVREPKTPTTPPAGEKKE